MRHGEQIPFDLRAFNVLFYENVTRWRKTLSQRLQSVRRLPEGGSEAESNSDEILRAVNKYVLGSAYFCSLTLVRTRCIA